MFQVTFHKNDTCLSIMNVLDKNFLMLILKVPCGFYATEKKDIIYRWKTDDIFHISLRTTYIQILIHIQCTELTSKLGKYNLRKNEIVCVHSLQNKVYISSAFFVYIHFFVYTLGGKYLSISQIIKY